MSMSSSSTSPKSYVPIALAAIPKDDDGNSQIDLYVFIPSQKKFCLFIPKGEKFTASRKTALERHAEPTLYTKAGAQDSAVISEQNAPDSRGKKNDFADFEILGVGQNAILSSVFVQLSKNLDEPPKEAIAELEKMADRIILVIAPEAQALKARILQNLKHLWLMNDASAIISIATLIAAANGINSAKPFRDLILAGLVMDMPLAKFEEDDLQRYYIDPKDMTSSWIEKYQQHPVEAYQLAKKALKHLSDPSFELILVHHELANGSGFPRQLKSHNIFPLGQFFCAAVDAFENIKVSFARGEPISLRVALLNLVADPEQNQNRRHLPKIVENVLNFVGTETV